MIIFFSQFIRSLSYNISLQQVQQTAAFEQKIEVLKLLLSMRKFEKRVYSQNGEDGVIEAIFNHIGTTDKYFVEFGTESGVQCNTRYLREAKNWTGLLMDGGFENKARNLHKEMIYPSNIVSLFKKYKVPKKFDLLSVDTDFKDWFILRNILKAGYRPRVLITEVNTFIMDSEAKTVPLESNQTRWDGRTQYFGFSVAAGWMLARHYGYSMVYCDVEGVNCFYVIDGAEGFGEGFRISDYYTVVALWKRNRLRRTAPY